MTSESILFLFSAIGVLNGSVLAVYFLFKSKRTSKDILMGFLLIALTIRVGKSVLLYFDPSLAPIFLQIGLSACFLIGPLVYSFIVQSVSTSKSPKVSWQLHISLILIFIVCIGILFPFQENVALWKKMHMPIYHIWLIYLVMASFKLREANLKSEFKAEWRGEPFFIYSVYAGNVVIWLSFYTFRITSYIAGALTFSFILYLLLLVIAVRFSTDTPVVKKKYIDKALESKEVERISKELSDLMENQTLFLDANLTMPDVAKTLKISPQKLSQFLNDNLNKSFSTYINEHRVNHAISILKSKKNITVEVLSENCGFNSTSTFYNAFRTMTGTTPAEFRKVN